MLQTFHRDVRATADGIQPPHRVAPQRGVSDFAQAIIDRYEGWQASWPHLELVLRQGQPTVVVHPVYHQTRIHLAPRLALTVRGETHMTWQPYSERARPASTERLVHRLLTREKRIETAMTTEMPETQGDAPLRILPPPAHPIPMVIHRPAVRTTADSQPLPPEVTQTVRGSQAAVTNEASQRIPAPMDVNRLTDQVVQAIDRRIIAQRERLGRI